MKPHKPTPPKPNSEPHCCSNPSPLIPIVIIAALFILAVVLGMILFQQDKIATQRQQLQACTNHIDGIQSALLEAKYSNAKLVKSGTNYFWIDCLNYQTGFTNHMEYPPRFLLKD